MMEVLPLVSVGQLSVIDCELFHASFNASRFQLAPYLIGGDVSISTAIAIGTVL